jgi:hypothetical protein
MPSLQDQLTSIQEQVTAIHAFLVADEETAQSTRKAKPGPKPNSKGAKPWTPARRKAHSKAIREGQAKAKRAARKGAKRPARGATAKKSN